LSFIEKQVNEDAEEWGKWEREIRKEWDWVVFEFK
jgi:hypothetical protein